MAVVEAVLSGRDALVVWPTDRGKSLCFQLAAVHTRKLVVVVTPIVSLMDDQVRQMNQAAKAAGQPSWAITLNHTQPGDADEQAVAQGSFSLAYMSEQRATSPRTLRLLESLHAAGRLLLIAVDEAHCISQWGPTFRERYLNLKLLRECMPSVPFLALTVYMHRALKHAVARSRALCDCALCAAA